jgi:hypothetical protein
MLQEHIKTSQSPSSGPDDASLHQAEDVREMIEIIKEQGALLLSQNQIMTEALTNMMSAIYNLIAQKDSNVGLRLANHSRTLAIESKRDSSSMKTIAAVTMAFLPGTFVSSFFAMPMFDWNKPPGSNVNTHTFWIYWTVTLPLTISVFLLWWAWFRFKTARDTREDKLLADKDRLDEKRNDGKSEDDYHSDSDTSSRVSYPDSPSPHLSGRSQGVWRLFRSVYQSRKTPRPTRLGHSRSSLAASLASRPSTPARIYSRPPTIATISSGHQSRDAISLPHPAEIPLPPSIASRPRSIVTVPRRTPTIV